MSSEVKVYNLYKTLPNSEVKKIGILAVKEGLNPQKSTPRIQFKYDDLYLADPNAFPLDPAQLPLQEDRFNFEPGSPGLPGFVDDILPDAWGKKVVAKKLDVNHPTTTQLLDNQAAAFTGAIQVVPATQRQRLIKSPGVDIDRVAQVLTYGTNLATLDELDEVALGILHRGSSVGGARPKILADDNGTPVLLKFERKDDPFNVLAAEHASLELARQLGLNAAKSELIELSEDFNAIKIERFDILDGGRGRHHMISMNTFLKNYKGEDPHHASYEDLARLIDGHSYQPEEDKRAIFKHMAINVALNNTDDHLRNFAMVHDEKGWRLSQAYDITPSEIASLHQLSCGLRNPTLSTIADQAEHFGLTTAEANDIVSQVEEVCSNWQSVFLEAGCSQEDINLLARGIKVGQPDLQANQDLTHSINSPA